MAMSQSNELLVEYDGETFSLLEAPKSTTKLVKMTTQSMLQNFLNLPQLSDDLSNLNLLLRLAYHGVVGHVELQIKVRKIFHDVVRLCDASLSTINQFRSASEKAIDSLQGTYEYLLDGLDDLAINNLENISQMAGKMALAAEHLSKEFRNEAGVVQSLEEETLRAESVANHSSRSEEEQKRLAEYEKRKQNKTFKDTSQTERELSNSLEEAQRMEMEALQKQRLGFLQSLINIFSAHYTGGERGVFDADRETAIREAEYHGKTKEKLYNDIIKVREQRRLALEKMESFAIEIEELDPHDKQLDLESTTAESLHHAASALASLGDIMEIASLFWQEFKGLLQQLNSPEMIKNIKTFSNIDDEKRKKALQNDAFKLTGVKYYSCWVAVKEICEACGDKMQDAQSKVHAYIREIPTREEALLTVKQLAPQLKAAVQNTITDLDKNQLHVMCSTCDS